jgi:hypothetical protein
LNQARSDSIQEGNIQCTPAADSLRSLFSCRFSPGMLFAASISRASIQFKMDTVFDGATPGGTAPWLTALFQDHDDLGAITSGHVRLTLTANLASGQLWMVERL